MKILVRATNWVGDAVMSLPALNALRAAHPQAHITIQARPWVADLYVREPFCDQVILHKAARGAKDWAGKLRLARHLRSERFDWAILLQNAFEAALIARVAGVPRRSGYSRDGRGWLLTDAVKVPAKGAIPRHESYYYLELMRQLGVISQLPRDAVIRLAGSQAAAEAGRERLAGRGITCPVIGVSPGAAYGTAKRWLPERFAEAASSLAAELGGRVFLFGSESERPLCEAVSEMIGPASVNLAGQTSLAAFIEYAAACRVFLTNDSGSMHIASALGVPTVAVFGATDAIATGPTGPAARVIQEPVNCSPCLLRECPIDHRCMNRVSSERVSTAALELLR